MPSEYSPDVAARSVLVCDLPPTTRQETVIIHFQKRKYGGGEVDSVELFSEGTAIVTFEDTEVAKSVLKHQHEINGSPVDVKPYNKEPREIFYQVTASLRLDDFNFTADYIKNVLEYVCTTTKAKWRALSDRFLVSGTFEQVDLARGLLRQHLAGNRDSQPIKCTPSSQPISEQNVKRSRKANACPVQDHQKADSTADTQEEYAKPDSTTFKVANHVLQVILRAHKDKLKQMLQFASLKQSKDKMSVTVTPKDNCGKATYKKVCKSFSDLYNKVYSQTKEESVSIVCRSKESREELEKEVFNVMKRFHVWVEIDAEKSPVRIYGLDSNVQSAKKTITRICDLEKEKGKREQHKRLGNSSEDCEVQNKNEVKRKSIEHTTATEVRIELCKGEVNSEAVDVIVNGVQAQPRKSVGGAKDAISVEGVESTTDDPKSCETGLSFALASQNGPCKVIIGAPLPKWAKEDEQQNRKRVLKIVEECIVLASGHRMKSIAFPSFASKPFELPLEVSAFLQFRAIKTWSKCVGPMNHGIRDVRVVVPDDSSFEQFKSQFVKFFPKTQVNGDICTPFKEKVGNETKRAKSVDKASKTPANTGCANGDQALELQQNLPRDVNPSKTLIPQTATDTVERKTGDYNDDQLTQGSSRVGGVLCFPNGKQSDQLQSETTPIIPGGFAYLGASGEEKHPVCSQGNSTASSKEDDSFTEPSPSQQESETANAMKPVMDDEIRSAKGKVLDENSSTKRNQTSLRQAQNENSDINHSCIDPPKNYEILEINCDSEPHRLFQQETKTDSIPSVSDPSRDVMRLSRGSKVDRSGTSAVHAGTLPTGQGFSDQTEEDSKVKQTPTNLRNKSPSYHPSSRYKPYPRYSCNSKVSKSTSDPASLHNPQKSDNDSGKANICLHHMHVSGFDGDHGKDDERKEKEGNLKEVKDNVDGAGGGVVDDDDNDDGDDDDDDATAAADDDDEESAPNRGDREHEEDEKHKKQESENINEGKAEKQQSEEDVHRQLEPKPSSFVQKPTTEGELGLELSNASQVPVSSVDKIISSNNQAMEEKETAKDPPSNNHTGTTGIKDQSKPTSCAICKEFVNPIVGEPVFYCKHRLCGGCASYLSTSQCPVCNDPFGIFDGKNSTVIPSKVANSGEDEAKEENQTMIPLSEHARHQMCNAGQQPGDLSPLPARDPPEHTLIPTSLIPPAHMPLTGDELSQYPAPANDELADTPLKNAPILDDQPANQKGLSNQHMQENNHKSSLHMSAVLSPEHASDLSNQLTKVPLTSGNAIGNTCSLNHTSSSNQLPDHMPGKGVPLANSLERDAQTKDWTSYDELSRQSFSSKEERQEKVPTSNNPCEENMPLFGDHSLEHQVTSNQAVSLQIPLPNERSWKPENQATKQMSLFGDQIPTYIYMPESQSASKRSNKHPHEHSIQGGLSTEPVAPTSTSAWSNYSTGFMGSMLDDEYLRTLLDSGNPPNMDQSVSIWSREFTRPVAVQQPSLRAATNLPSTTLGASGTTSESYQVSPTPSSQSITRAPMTEGQQLNSMSQMSNPHSTVNILASTSLHPREASVLETNQPTASKPVPRNQPPGQMSWKVYKADKQTGRKLGIILITYTFYDGVQGEDHPYPGQPYRGLSQKAYLPDTTEGRTVLKLFRKAFDAQLMFTVTASSNRTAYVTWNGITHITSIDGDKERSVLLDPGYFKTVKKELAEKGL